MNSNKLRLDEYLVKKSLASNLNIARSIIMQGLVHDSNKLLDKPGLSVHINDEIFIKARKTHEFVSRAALKLKKGIEEFQVSIKDKTCLDLGCGAGGFTQILLQYGAKKVFAVDVAYGELAWDIRNNPKVEVLERVNARYLTEQQITSKLDIIVCDVSFISLKMVMAKAFEFTSKNCQIISLIKPQFEAARNQVGAKGIIKDDQVHQAICQEIKSWFEENNCKIHKIIDSPILGTKGNKEFLIHATRNN